MKRLVFILGVLWIALKMPSLTFGQETSSKVIVETPGTLADLVSDLDVPRLLQLTIEGALNSDDLAYIGETSGRISTVKELDMSKVTLTGEGRYKKVILGENPGGTLGVVSANFMLSDSCYVELKKEYNALGGESHFYTYHGKDLGGLFAGTKYRKVILPENLPAIGVATFFATPELEEVVIPEGVEKIGKMAFQDTESLGSLTLPSTLKSVDQEAFLRSQITSVSVPPSLESIGYSAFEKSQLAHIDLSNVIEIGDNCFRFCQLEGRLDLSSLEIIPKYAFYNNQALTEVILSESLREIGAEAFSGCNELTTINIPSTIQKLGDRAFYGTPWDKNLKGVDGIIYIGTIAYAFAGGQPLPDPTVLTFREGTTDICSNFNIESLYESEETGKTINPAQDIVKIVFPSSLRRIQGFNSRYKGFKNLENLKTIEFNEGLEYIGDNTFYNIYSLENVEFKEGLSFIGEAAFRGCDKAEFSPFPSTLKHVGNYAFEGCSKLWFDHLPEDLEHIGDYAFSKCIELTSLTIPTNLKYFGEYAFYGCDALYYVKLLNDMPYLQEFKSPFGAGVYKVEIGKEVTAIPPKLFACGVKKVVFESPEERTSPITLGAGCFAESGLKSIELPPVAVIGSGAFPSCLESLTVNGDCDYIDEYAIPDFYKDAKDIRINGRIKNIRRNAFAPSYSHGWVVQSMASPCADGQGYSSFQAISCDTISQRAFYNCSLLATLKFEEGVKHIGKEAFYGCENLTSFPFSKGMTFEEGAFRETGLRSAKIDMEEIPAEAFWNCQSLRDVALLTKPVKVGEKAFSGCYYVRNFDFSKLEYIGSGAFWHVGFSDLTTLTIPSCIKEIGEGAFNGCGFSEISLPGHYLNVEMRAFYGDGHERILEWRPLNDKDNDKIGNSGENVIWNLAFASSIGNEELIIPEGVNRIEESAFWGAKCSRLILPSTLYDFVASSFGNASNLKAIICQADYPPYITKLHPNNSHYLPLLLDGSVYVPSGSMERYKEAPGWGEYFDIQPLGMLVEWIKLSDSTITLEEGDTYELSVELTPSYIPESEISWESEDPKIARIDKDGKIRAVKEGCCKIKVSSPSGMIAQCEVIVMGDSGIETIDVNNIEAIDANMPVDIYSIQGALVAKDYPVIELPSITPGLYILRQGQIILKLRIQ